jgi:hypothetical protein
VVRINLSGPCADCPEQAPTPHFAGAVWAAPPLAQRGFKGRFAAEKQENQRERQAAAKGPQMLLKAVEKPPPVATYS